MARKDIELRDYYAGIAMQALFAVHTHVYEGADVAERIAEDAFEMANLMMAQRECEDMDCD